MPVLDDDGYIITDSHAINAYLVTQYGKNDYLYPKDPRRRGLVDQRLYFHSGTLFPRLTRITVMMPITQFALSIFKIHFWL